MNNKPRVSVIIPTYKSNESLKTAVDSVLNQTYQNIEVIVVDDNNPDTEYRKTTEKIMQEYKENNKVIYIKHEKNKNGAAARNTGFNISKGEFICFLDDDDVFLQNKIYKQVEYLMSHYKYQAVYCWRYQNSEIVKSNKVGDLSEELLSLSFTPYTSTIMLRRECYERLNGFDEKYKRHQDFEFLLRFFEQYSIGVVEEPLVEIRGNQVNNALKGRELEELKYQFLNQFSHHIDRINSMKNGFTKLVLARHYSTVFWSYCSQFRPFSALRIFFKYSIECDRIFWACILNYLKHYLDIKLKKKKRRYKPTSN